MKEKGMEVEELRRRETGGRRKGEAKRKVSRAQKFYVATSSPRDFLPCHRWRRQKFLPGRAAGHFLAPKNSAGSCPNNPLRLVLIGRYRVALNPKWDTGEGGENVQRGKCAGSTWS